MKVHFVQPANYPDERNTEGLSLVADPGSFAAHLEACQPAQKPLTSSQGQVRLPEHLQWGSGAEQNSQATTTAQAVGSNKVEEGKKESSTTNDFSPLFRFPNPCIKILSKHEGLSILQGNQDA